MRRLLLLLLVLVAACVDFEAPVDPTRPEPFELEVPKGASASGLTDRLVENGLVPGEWQWKWFLRNTNAGCLKAGRFEVRRNMSMRELLDTLCGPPLPEDVPFTIVEGWRIRDIDAALAARGWIQPGVYIELATTKAVPSPFPIEGPTLEGYLFPETYMVIEKEFDPSAFLQRQLQTFHDRFLVVHGDKLGERSLHEVVIMASMLEREEPTPAQRPIVAGILYKRLAANWKLGVDATSRYTLAEWNDRQAFLTRLRDPDDVYNTRLRSGLPPTAIGNPGLVSLQAAIAPEESPWWYYLHDKNGVFHGAVDGAGHEANRLTFNVY
jgi:UPF0755 protein